VWFRFDGRGNPLFAGSNCFHKYLKVRNGFITLIYMFNSEIDACVGQTKKIV